MEQRNSTLSEYLRFTAKAAPVLMVLIFMIDLYAYRGSRDQIEAQHDRDLAITMINAKTTLDNLLTVAQDDYVDRKLLDNLLTNYTKFPGVGCVKLDKETLSIIQPPENFCIHLDVDNTQDIELDTGGFLTFYLDDKYLKDLQNENFKSLVLQTSLISLAFILINFWAFKFVFEKHFRTALNRNQKLFQNSPVAQVEIQHDGTLVFSSVRWTELFGETDQRHVSDFLEKTERAAFLNYFKSQNFSNADNYDNKFKFVSKLGTAFLASVECYRLENDYSSNLVLAVHDIEEMQKKVLEKATEARTDSLTGALTRRALEEDFLSFGDINNLIIAMFDIDQFKLVNDLYGYNVGDAVIAQTARYISQNAPAASSIYRIGGEEFIVLSPKKNAANFDWNLFLKGFEEIKFESDLESFSRSLSGCISTMEIDSDLSQNLKKCDRLVSQAKAMGGNTIISDDNSNSENIDAHDASTVKNALEENEFFFDFQPIYNSQDMKIIGAEALIRWKSKRGILYPRSFIKSYYRSTSRKEDSKRRHLQFLRALDKFPFGNDVYISYNITIEDIIAQRDEELIESLSPALVGRNIVLELSEEEFGRRMTMPDIAEVLKKIRSCGFLIALDDFGKSSSNFNRFIEMPIDIIKADLALVNGIDYQPKKQAVMKALLQICEEFNVALIAEGVERKQEKNYLDGIGVYHQQGFLYLEN